MNNPLVSVVIPTYSRPDNLCRAIESVLAQTYSPIEIIVVDDNGEGTEFQLETESVLQAYITSNKIIYIKHETNKNGSAARNTGYRASKGEFINFLDDDDIFDPRKIEFQVYKLRELPEEYGACYCWRRTCCGGKVIELCEFSEEGDLRDSLMTRKVYFNTTAILFRRNVLNKLNGWDESFIRNQDWEILMRFFRQYKIAVVTGIPLMDKNTSSKPALGGKNWYIPVREKFLATFQEDILNLPHSNEIMYFNYICCSNHAALTLDYKTWWQYLRKALKYHTLKTTDIKVMARNFIKGLLMKTKIKK